MQRYLNLGAQIPLASRKAADAHADTRTGACTTIGGCIPLISELGWTSSCHFLELRTSQSLNRLLVQDQFGVSVSTHSRPPWTKGTHLKQDSEGQRYLNLGAQTPKRIATDAYADTSTAYRTSCRASFRAILPVVLEMRRVSSRNLLELSTS